MESQRSSRSATISCLHLRRRAISAVISRSQSFQPRRSAMAPAMFAAPQPYSRSIVMTLIMGTSCRVQCTLNTVLLTIGPQALERPKWLRAPAPVGRNYRELKELITDLKLHTVCESAACPNVGECWNRRTATFMILGNVCTRRCGFCAVQKGGPLPVDYDEPRRVAEACAALGLNFAVVTSVNRDDRKDGGAELFALTIRAIRQRLPACGVEVLVPDFQGSHAAMDIVLEAAPDILNHNTETVPRLYRQVRLGARYERSLDMLAHVKRARPAIPTKSGLMLGLGETIGEVLDVMRDLRESKVDILTLGQYMCAC